MPPEAVSTPTPSTPPALTGATPASTPSAPATPPSAPVSPTPASPAKGADSSSPSEKFFEDLSLLEETETGELEAPLLKAPEAKVPKAEAPKAAPKEPAIEPPKVEAPKPTEPIKAEETPKPAEPAPMRPEAIRAQTPEEQKAVYTKWRGDQEARLRTLYALDPDEGELMLSKPEDVLPKMAARLHMDVYEAVLGEMQQHLPRIMTGLLEAHGRVKENEDKFFGQWPKLRPHYGQVFKFMQSYRQLNPAMPADEFAQQVGLAMMAALKIPFEPTTPAPPKPNGPQELSREVVQPGLGGFTPAPSAGYAPTSPLAPAVSKNEFSILAEEILADQ
jgi:hypothetical protein